MDYRKARILLRDNGCDKQVLEHCTAVSELAHDIAKRIEANGTSIDTEFVKVAGLLHDIGRSRTHGIDHGIAGADILKDYPKYARVCERHIGAGLKAEEALRLGLPAKDYMPETLEEKVIAHADNLVDCSKVITLEETLEDMMKKLGPDHPQIRRTRELGNYIDSLID
ncbi:MAG: TIGR00295 family protein [Candidatus Altiarchaeota archaeon]